VDRGKCVCVLLCYIKLMLWNHGSGPFLKVSQCPQFKSDILTFFHLEELIMARCTRRATAPRNVLPICHDLGLQGEDSVRAT